MGHAGGKRGTNCGNKRFLPDFYLFWCLHTGVQPCDSYCTSLCFLITPLACVCPGECTYSAHSPQHHRDPAFGLPVTFSSNASNLFLCCLLFPSASEPAARIAEFTRADGIPWEGSRAAFWLLFMWFSHFTYA